MKIKDYRLFIKEKVEIRKKMEPKVNFSGLSKAIRVSPHYLSRVVGCKSHLNEDHVFLAAKYLGLDLPTTSYLQSLHQHARSTSDEHKKLLLKDIKRKKAELSSTKTSLKVDKHEKTDLNFDQFFLKPTAQLIYTALFIPKFQLNPELLCRPLSISREQLDKELSFLLEIELIVKARDKVIPIAKRLHLSSDHPFFEAYQKLVRQEMQKFSDETIKFSVFTSVSDEDVEEINKVLVQALKKIEKISMKSNSETLIGIQLDLIKCLVSD